MEQDRTIDPKAMANFGDARRVSVAVAADERKARLFARFESLGDNCEFGLVQRWAGIEPLGLLRFNFIFADALIWMLRTKFQGLGDPALTEFVKGKSEYFVKDKRISGMAMHTFTKPGTVDHENFVTETLKRIMFLKRKLLEDLESAGKVFVFKTNYVMKDEQLRRLIAALRAYNPAIRLLFVRPGTMPGKAIPLDERTSIGHLSTVWPIERAGDPLNGLCFDEWTDLCADVLRMHGEVH